MSRVLVVRSAPASHGPALSVTGWDLAETRAWFLVRGCRLELVEELIDLRGEFAGSRGLDSLGVVVQPDW